MPNKKPRTVQILKGTGSPFKSKKIGRNDPCPCSSGLKSKKCCNQDTQYYKTK